MRMIISMKIINCNDWTPRNNMNIPITDPPVDLQMYFAYSPGRLAWFYYKLAEFGIYGFLYKGDYFNESDYL
ncbi:hypothetical protein [Microcystis phage LMM01]|uniref:Uncharacterized protein n=1 Tax=Microcystis phage LMM01 TaxID=2856824 RepID=A0A7Q6_9CAUD|nr:hypothetical protein MaLMM01_gp142 [Microcystis phage LMM01]BAF36233.1 hypothetical protein [Microcystis phage LMM01]